jgi:hypothetical protein
MGAVQNAMQRDGLDPTVMDLDHNRSVASQLKKDEDDGPPLKDDPKYHKYFKVWGCFFCTSSMQPFPNCYICCKSRSAYTQMLKMVSSRRL